MCIVRCRTSPFVIDCSHSYAGNSAHGFENCADYFPDTFRRCRGALPETSGKFSVLSRMLNMLRYVTDLAGSGTARRSHPRAHRSATTTDRIVLVSNYTKTLDLFARMLHDMGFPYLRLDGSTNSSKRMVCEPTPRHMKQVPSD